MALKLSTLLPTTELGSSLLKTAVLVMAIEICLHPFAAAVLWLTLLAKVSPSPPLTVASTSFTKNVIFTVE
jgi:hypothetical protein